MGLVNSALSSQSILPMGPKPKVADSTSLETLQTPDKPIQSKATFDAARQTQVGKSDQVINASQTGQQIKQGIEQADSGQLLEHVQTLMQSSVVSEEFGMTIPKAPPLPPPPKPSPFKPSSGSFAITADMLVAARQKLKTVSQHQVLNLGDLSTGSTAKESTVSRKLGSEVGGVPLDRDRLPSADGTIDIVGHSSDGGMTIEGRNPQQLAQLLKDQYGLQQIQTINLVSCKSEEFKAEFKQALADLGVTVGNVEGAKGNVAVDRATGKMLDAAVEGDLGQIEGHDGVLGLSESDIRSISQETLFIPKYIQTLSDKVEPLLLQEFANTDSIDIHHVVSSDFQDKLRQLVDDPDENEINALNLIVNKLLGIEHEPSIPLDELFSTEQDDEQVVDELIQEMNGISGLDKKLIAQTGLPDFLVEAVCSQLESSEQIALKRLQTVVSIDLNGDYGMEWSNIDESARSSVVGVCNKLDISIPEQKQVAIALMAYLPPWEHSQITNPAVRGLVPISQINKTTGQIQMPPDKSLMHYLMSTSPSEQRSATTILYRDGLGRDRPCSVYLSPNEKQQWPKNNHGQLIMPANNQKATPLSIDLSTVHEEPKRWGFEVECKDFPFALMGAGRGGKTDRLFCMDILNNSSKPLFSIQDNATPLMDICLDGADNWNHGIFEIATAPVSKQMADQHLHSCRDKFEQFLCALRDLSKADDPTTLLAQFKADYHPGISDYSLMKLSYELRQTVVNSDNLVNKIVGGSNQLCQVTTSVPLTDRVKSEIEEGGDWKGRDTLYKASAEAINRKFQGQQVFQIFRHAYQVDNSGNISYLQKLTSKATKTAPFGAMVRQGIPVVLEEHREDTHLGKNVGKKLLSFLKSIQRGSIPAERSSISSLLSDHDT